MTATDGTGAEYSPLSDDHALFGTTLDSGTGGDARTDFCIAITDLPPGHTLAEGARKRYC